MRTLVFGDIHGCLSALDAVLTSVAPRQNDWLIFLGDYIDRGSQSAKVLDRLIQLRMQHQTIMLMGNHEQMLLGARTNPLLHREWIANGGDTTLSSYGSRNKTLQDIPAAHWTFMASLPMYYETGSHIFVHAGVDPVLTMNRQPEYTLLWERFSDPLPHVSGKTVICGHTPGKRVRNVGHAMCIDTGVFRIDGLLTCVDLQALRMVQANQRGQVRGSRLPQAGAV
jgi:serine/threonine protein phosphatase 1